MQNFTPKSVMYPTGGSRHDVQICGSIPSDDSDDIAENIQIDRNFTFTNKELAAQYRSAITVRDEAVKAAQESHKLAHEALVQQIEELHQKRDAAIKAASEAHTAARKELDTKAIAEALELIAEQAKPRE